MLSAGATKESSWVCDTKNIQNLNRKQHKLKSFFFWVRKSPCLGIYLADLRMYQIWLKIWKLSVLLMLLKGKRTSDGYNDDSKCFMIVNKNATSKLTHLRNTSLRHAAALLNYLIVSSQNISFPPPDKFHSIFKNLYGQLSSCQRLWKLFSFVFHTFQKIFCFGLCAFKGRTEILTKALFMSVFNCWLTTLFLHAGRRCWIISLARRSRQWNWTPLPQSQITANLKGLLLKDYWVSENKARKKNIFFSHSNSDPWTQDSYFYRPHQHVI